MIIGSLRTLKITLDPDEFIKDAFGRDVAGFYYGDGKISAGGLQTPIGFLSGEASEQYRQHEWKVFDEQINWTVVSSPGIWKSHLLST